MKSEYGPYCTGDQVSIVTNGKVSKSKFRFVGRLYSGAFLLSGAHNKMEIATSISPIYRRK